MRLASIARHASSMSVGMPSRVAKSLAVPAGSTATGRFSPIPLYQIHCVIDAAVASGQQQVVEAAVHCGEDRFVAGIERKTVKQHVQAVSLVEFDDAVEAAGYRALSRRGIIDEEYFS